MRKTITKLLVIFIAGLLTISCDKKKEEIIEPVSAITYKDKTYDLTYGFWGAVEDDSLEFNGMIMSLYSSALKLEYREGKVVSASGIVDGLSLSFTLRKGAKELEPGEYTCATNIPVKDRTPNTFEGGIFINKDITKGAYLEDYLATGKITVKKNNNIYELNFDCIGGKGNTIKGLYKGELIKSN